VAANENEGVGSKPKWRPRGVDLADIKAEVDATRPSTTDVEIAAAIAMAKADRVGQVVRGESPDTASGILKRAMLDSDPLGAAIEAAGVFRGGAAERAMREALNGDLVSRAAAGTIAGSLAERAIAEAYRGSFVDRTAREIVEAEHKMSDLVLGRTPADRELASAVMAAQGTIGQLHWGSHYSTGRAAMAALEDT
jgi:hypothetical protein